MSLASLARTARVVHWRQSTAFALRRERPWILVSTASGCSVLVDAAMRHRNVGLQQYSSSSGKTCDEVIHKDEPVARRTSDDSTEEMQPYLFGSSNFRKMLHHQEMSRRKPNSMHNFNGRESKVLIEKKDTMEGKSRADSTRAGSKMKKIVDTGQGTPDVQISDGVEKRPRAATFPQSYDRHPSLNEAVNAQRPHQHRRRWSTKQRSPHQSKKQAIASDPPKPKLATSSWVLITNIPQTSNLSDLYQSLNDIIDHEIDKGIIDLDALENISQSDGGAFDALDAIGALDSFYSSYKIDDHNIPLWKPPDGSQPDNKCSVVQEARIHLSLHARPIGWFLRLPNRSVVHALLNHVQRAEEKQKLESNQGNLEQERREWMEALCEGVWTNLDNTEEMGQSKPNNENDNEKESEDEGEEDEDMNMLEKNPFDDGDEFGQIDADNYLQHYMNLHPYPTNSTMPQVDETFQHHLLKSGSKSVTLQEFFPDSLETLSSKDSPWEQHSFHVSPLLDLSDSVLRIEAFDWNTSLSDIQHLFRYYQMESVTPDSVESVPHGFPESFGWLINRNRNPDVLLEGGFKSHTAEGDAEKKARAPVFLLRFASPSDARMAVRDKDGHQLLTRNISAKQYPRQG
ncbi:hypothetical protein ACHAWF_004755 [Thalassiosira exigua]